MAAALEAEPVTIPGRAEGGEMHKEAGQTVWIQSCPAHTELSPTTAGFPLLQQPKGQEAENPKNRPRSGESVALAAQGAFGALKRLKECTRSVRPSLLCSSAQRSVVGPNGTEGVSGASYLTRAVPFQSSSGCASCSGSAALSRRSVARQPKGGLLRLQTRAVSRVRGVAECRRTRSRVSFQQPRALEDGGFHCTRPLPRGKGRRQPSASGPGRVA
ncbi:hypothetical protein NDU88_005458 [Pleurodeles waltl]|uniref:Uncharacterized protein n=1 Tax=Pleurodeles waltl TaxID=8319 RepID=A0AAV7LCI3_PLEWA|nr:hypothetical protein NDU88_005458 [Pleurodeles waltl]